MALTTPADISMFLPKPAVGGAPPGGLSPTQGAAYGLGALGAVAGAPPPEQSGSLFSLATLGNLYRDIVNVPVGLYNLVGTAVSDAVRSPVGVIEEAGTLGFAHTDVKVLTPTFVAKIPIDFASNLKNYYLTPHVIGNIQQHPLQPIMDALTIAGGAGAIGRFATATGTTAAAEGAALVAKEAAAGSAEAGAAVAESAAAAEATNAVVGAAASGSAVLPPAGGMAGAFGRFVAGRSEGLASWMESNAQVLANYRAGALARADVPGALQAGEDVRNAAATSDALGIMQQPTLPVVGAVRDGLRSVGEVASEFRAADPLTKRAMLLDVTNPEPLMIAEQGSGAVFGQAQGIQPGYNPLLRAVWSDPLRSKFLSETVPEWENRVLAPLREKAAEAETAGTMLDRGVQTELDAAEAAFARMTREGAQLVASKGYAGGLFAKRGIEQGVQKIVGSSVALASGKRREVAGDLGQIVQAAEDMGVTPEDIQTKTHLLLQGLHDGQGFDYTPEELGALVRDKGWADPEAAARDLVTQSGNFQALNLDEQNGLLRMVKNGQIPIEGLWRYSPDPTLSAIPERQAFEEKFRATADQSGLTRQHQDMLMMMYDSTAKAMERNGIHTAADIYGNMDMRFEETFMPGAGKELRQMGTDPLQGFAARTAIGRLAPGTDVEQLVKRVQRGLNDHITASEATYTADEAAVVLWNRTRSLVQDELNGIQRKMRELPLIQRRKLGSYAEKLQSFVDSADPAAWDALKKTKYGKGLTERMTAELSSAELAQKIGSEIRGATMFGPEFSSLTRIFRTGDFTTYVHEFGHVLRRILPDDVQAELHGIYLAKNHPGMTAEQVAAEQGPTEMFQKPPEPPPDPEAIKANVEANMDGFTKRVMADIAKPADAIIAPSEADVQVMDAVEEEMASNRTGGGDHLYPGTAGYKGLQAAGVHITDEAAWADVPTDLKPGAQVAFAGDSVIDGDVGRVVMLDPTKDIQLGNEILASKYQPFTTVDPADFQNMPIVYQYGDMKVAMEGNHRIYRARQFGEAKLKVLLVDGKTKVPDVIDVGPPAEAPSEAAGITSRLTNAEEQAAQDAFAAKLAEAAPPEAAAAPVAAPGEVAAEVPPAAPPPTTPPIGTGMGPNWTRPMEEAFANDLEKWFYKGIKPDNPRLLPIFHVIGEQLTDMWRKMRGQILDTGAVPDEAAKVFDSYVGDVFTQMKSKGDQPVPAALYRGRRRVRTLEGVPDASQVYGDGSVVQQLPAADGTITIQNLRDRAVMAGGQTEAKLRGLFGGKPGATPLHPHRATSRGVTTTLKPMEQLTARMDEGARVTDAVRSRVLIPSWKEGDAYLQQLSSQFDIVGVDDFRAHPGSGGQTGLKAYVVDPAAPDIVQEVEFTTLLGNQHRDAFAYHDQALGKVERDYATEEQTIARLSQSTHPNQAGVQQSIDEHVKALEALEIQRESGRRYMEQSYEMLRDEVARDFGQLGPADAQRRLVEKFRLFNAKWSERDLFQMGYADFQRLLERSYLPLRIKSAPDENVLDIMEGKSTQAKSALTLDDELAAQGTPAPVYFPHMEQPDRFAYSTPHGQGMRKLAKNPHLRGTTGELFKEGNYVTDPFQAYSLRAAKAIKMQDAFHTVQDITQHYGRKISHPDNLAEGERLFAPDFALAFYKAIVGVDDRFSSMMNNIDNEQVVGAWREMSSQMGRDLALTDIATAGIENTLGIGQKEAASLYQAVYEAIPKAQRELVGVTRRGLDLYAVPRNVMENLDKQMSKMAVNNFTVGWDSYTHLWRALALYGSPRWVLNNLVGNISMAALEGVKLREVISAATDRTDRWYLHELAKMTDRATEIDRGWFGASELYPNELAGRGAETMIGQAERFTLSQIRRSPVDFAKPVRWWKDFIKGFNTDMENVFRETGFVQGVREAQRAGVVDMPSMRNALRSAWSSKEDMQRMLSEGITERGFQAGMDRMVKTFGDFSTLSPFERNVVRRYIAPFWGFYRHVGAMLLRAPFTHPFKTQLVAALAREDQAMRAQYGDLPEWTDQMTPFGPMGPDGKMTFLSVAGPNPFNPFADLGLSSLHPAIQAGIEMLTGRDVFTGQEFTDPNVVTPFGSDQRFRIVRGPNGEPIDAVPVDKVTPSAGEELLNQFPFYPQLKQLAAGGRAYDTQGVIGSINNPVTNAAGQTASPYGVGNFVGQQVGVNIKNYDIAGYQARLEEQRQAALKMAYDSWAGVPSG